MPRLVKADYFDLKSFMRNNKTLKGQHVFIIKGTCFAGIVGTRAIGREGEGSGLKFSKIFFYIYIILT